MHKSIFIDSLNVSLDISPLSSFAARSPDGLGVDPGPLDLFDPLGLMEDTDGFARRRAVEIKARTAGLPWLPSSV